MTRRTLPFTIGRSASGELVVADLTEMPNLLVAGSAATEMNSWVHCVLTDLSHNFPPQKLERLILHPDGPQFRRWVIPEMTKRLAALSAAGVRNIEAFNAKAPPEQLPYWAILLDDLVGEMPTLAQETEQALATLAPVSRVTGIHVILATPLPEALVLTGVVQASFTTRVAFKVASAAASQLILGASGAEKLIGANELLYRPNDSSPCIPLRRVSLLELSAARKLAPSMARRSDKENACDCS